MSILDVTYHSLTNADAPRYSSGGVVGTVPPQEGNSQQLDFSSGAAPGAVQTNKVLAIFTPDADCRVASGASDIVAITSNSRLCKANVTSEIVVAAGGRLSVVAAS